MAGFRIPDFDTWRPGYAGASVKVYIAGTASLASLFADQGLTVPLANPQTLLTLESSDIQYGKFSQPVYVGGAVELEINSTDRTGVIRNPLFTLAGEDAGAALVKPDGASVSTTLSQLLSRFVHAEDFGVLDGASAAVNTATLNAAIGAAAGQGGGAVLIPAGTFPFNPVTLPGGVALVGAGRGVTVLQCPTGAAVVTVSGDRAGFCDLTLDGQISFAASVGVLMDERDEILFDNAEVKRFETGIKMLGGERCHWSGLYIENCGTGVLYRGDGAAVRHNEWRGGLVTNCTVVGVFYEYFDALVIHNMLAEVGFENNPVVALKIEGARFLDIDNCWFLGPDATADLLTVLDDSPANDDNTIQNLNFFGCRFQLGEIGFEDSCESVILDHCRLTDVDIALTLPLNAIIARDCIEDAQVTLAGEGTKFLRWKTGEHGVSTGITTDASATKAWGFALQPGQVGFFVAMVLGNQLNGINTGEYYIGVSARRPGSSLAYDAQVANFTVGQIVTGANTGASGRITADADGGATGTLTLRDIDGEFQDNETITDPLGGQATVNGTLSHQNAVLLGTVEALRPAREDVAGWDATFAANGPEIEVRVTGAGGQTVAWTVSVDVTQT
jgi:hypothetical protein